MQRAGLVCVFLAMGLLGCGDNAKATADGPVTADGPPSTADGPPMIDAPRPDAAPTTGRYVLSAIDVPTTTTEAQTLGMDIDSGEPNGDAEVDNQLGLILAAVAGMGFDVQTGVTFSIDHGLSITLVDLRADASLHTIPGSDPMPPACESSSDTVCRHHLTGTASFDMPTGATTGTMPTTTTGGVTTGGPGTAVFDLALLGSTTPVQLDVIGARFEGTIDANGITSAKMAGAVSSQQINDDVLPAVAAAFRTLVEMECTAGQPPPGCGCPTGSQSLQLIQLFDNAPQNCVISNAEVRNNSLIQALFMPDVNIGGVDGLSLGVGVEGVGATFRFTPP